MHKKIGFVSLVMSVFALSAGSVFAHVIVTPNEVGIGKFQTFSVSVPNEKDVPVTGLRLVMPDSLKEVAPTVKAGWQITVKKSGEGDAAKVSEIDWTGGSIPAGQRDDFTYSAQVPATTTTLQWKAYQTYQDGTVVAWDHAPNPSNGDDDSITPYSQTKIMNDLTTTAETNDTSSQNRSTIALTLSILAVLLGSVAVLTSKRK